MKSVKSPSLVVPHCTFIMYWPGMHGVSQWWSLFLEDIVAPFGQFIALKAVNALKETIWSFWLCKLYAKNASCVLLYRVQELNRLIYLQVSTDRVCLVDLMASWFQQQSLGSCTVTFSGGSKVGREGHATPPLGPNSFNFMQILGKLGRIVCWHPRRVSTPPAPNLAEILNPPLTLVVAFWFLPQNFGKVAGI